MSELCPFGFPTLLMKNKEEKEEVNVFDVETSISFKINSIKEMTGGISSNKN